MKRDKKALSKKDKRRLKFIRETREQRNIAKYNIDFIFPKKRDIRFSDPKEKK
ncbi:hypothetical protein ES702_06991 [subsurface metagenome]